MMNNKSKNINFSLKDFEKVKDIFRNFLKKKKLKITRERNQIVEFIFKTNYHFNVENLEKELNKENIQTSRATIYRTLDLLVESKLIDRIHFGETSYYYEYIYGQPHHYHIICKECQQIIEFISKEIFDIQEKICEKFNFFFPEHQFKIFGICSNCQKKNNF